MLGPVDQARGPAARGGDAGHPAEARRHPGPARGRHRRARRGAARRRARGRGRARPSGLTRGRAPYPRSSAARCGTAPTSPGAGRARPARPADHGLLRQGRLRQDDARHQPRRRARRPRPPRGLPRRPRPGLRRRRDRAAALPGAHDRRRGPARRHPGRRRRVAGAADPALPRPHHARRAGRARRGRGDPRRRWSPASCDMLKRAVRLRRRRHPAGVRRPRARGVRPAATSSRCSPRWTSRR